MKTRAATGLAELDDTLSDEQLLSLLLVRDARAWKLFVRRYRAPNLAAIRSVLARFSSRYLVDVDDVEAALMASLVANDMAKLRSFDPERNCKLGAWLSLLARRAAWNHVRDCRRRSDLSNVLRHAPGTSPESDAVRIMIARQQCDRLQDLADGLSEKERHFFRMLYIDEASVPEIADSMHISLNTVYTKNYKLRSKLEPALEEATKRRRLESGVRRARAAHV